MTAPQLELIGGLPPSKAKGPAAARLDTTQRNRYKGPVSTGPAASEPRPSWATPGTPLHEQGRKREKGEPLRAVDRVRGKRVQLLRSRIVANALAQLPESLVDVRKYEATLRCGHEVTRARFDGKRDAATLDFGRCCRHRWCEFCSAARLGEWRRRFQPELASWKSLYHLVVTVPTVRHCTERKGARRLNRITAVKLRYKVQEMLKATREIANDVRRTAKLPWKAIRHVEVTYTWERDGQILDWYHPHIHFVVENEAAAREFLRRWLLRFPDCSPAAQFCESVDLAKAMREVFKYVCKAVKTERSEVRDGDGRVMRDSRTGKRIWAVKYKGMRADALDVIYAALRGIRLHQAMGFRAPMPDDVGDVSHGVPEDGTLPPALPDFECDASTWRWSDAALDWLSSPLAGLDQATGEVHGASVALCDRELPLRYLKMLAEYEAQIFVGVARLGGVRSNGLVAKCYQIRRAAREDARTALSGLTTQGGSNEHGRNVLSGVRNHGAGAVD